jgi:hypothetical protein
MGVPGLSLVGFLNQSDATAHLTNQCICASLDPASLNAEWNAAREKLGAPFPNAGHPDIQPIPHTGNGHLQLLQAAPWVTRIFGSGGLWHGCEFKMIELDPLLSVQFAIEDGRAKHFGVMLTTPPTMDELLKLCLPLSPPAETFQTFNSPGAIILKARSLNLISFGGGMFNTEFMGIQFGASLSFLPVVRLNGRCYLHNGFHRALAIRKAGATHAPCIFRDVSDHATAGIRTDGATFGVQLLESTNPPTVGHFTQGRAYDVQLKSFARYLHVSWAEYIIPDE